jgi:hypothetical protein
MKHSMKKISLLLLSLLAVLRVAAVNYSTLKSGDWTDETSVWSTDGVTPCHCSPSTNFSDHVTVNHMLDMNADVTVLTGGVFDIGVNGVIAYRGFQLTIDGAVNNYGSMLLKSLKTRVGGSFVNSGFIIVTLGPLTNQGSMIINGPFELEEGIFENKEGGYFTIGSNVHVVIKADDAFNKGVMEFMGGDACFTVETKNFYNQNPHGEVRGAGGIFVQGDLTNLSLWENTVNWCAAGSLKGSSPMPPENCGGVCTAPYPVTLTDFRADVRADFVNLSWKTLEENNLAYFAIESQRQNPLSGGCTINGCNDTGNWTQIGTVPAKGSGSRYYYTNKETEAGLYRLRITDVDGGIQYSPVVSVIMQEGKPGLLIYPNPSNGELNIRMTGVSGTTISVEIYDMAGRRIWKYNGSLSGNMQEINFNTCDLSSGTYLVKYQHLSTEAVQKLVVQK